MSLLETQLDRSSLALRNRLVMPPMATSKAHPDGRVSDELLAYYDEKTRCRMFGLVITEHCFVSEQGRNRIGQPSVAEDSMIEGLRVLAEVLHRNGAKAVVQMSHAGASSMVPGRELVGPSNVATPLGLGTVPRPLTRDEIAEVVWQFAEAARRVKTAGFDGVEIHSAHGYLLNQFFSPITNRRDDEYGGDLTDRIIVHREVITAVREAVGPEFAILLRLGACDYLDGGSEIADGVAASEEFERAGVDVLDITGGLSGYVRPGHDEPGYFSELSGPIKRAVKVPVILTGGVTQRGQAEQLLAEGSADLIGVGRALLKDSNWGMNTDAE